MNKIWKSIIFTGLLLTGITAACSSPLVSATQINTETSVPTAGLTETATPAATLTESAPPASATPEFAPFCEADTASTLPAAQCQIPIAKESSTFCTDKNPYNLILIDTGLTYEVLTKGFRCSDAGKKGDKQMITCTGQMAASFEINVCNPSCVVPTVQADVVQCPQDYHYNNVQGCCTQELQQINQNCTVLKFQTTSCVVDCGVFTRKPRCIKNSYACEWNDAERVCQLRK